MSDSTERTERLHSLLGGPALAALRGRLRRSFEQAEPGVEPTLLRLSALAAHEAEALQGLSGRAPRRSASLQLDLVALAQRLQAAGLGHGLRDVLEQIDGPIAPRAAQRAAAASAWAAVLASPQHPALRALLAQPVGAGLLRRLAGGDAARASALCEQATRVLAALPGQGQPRASLAARCLGNAHALDPGQPVATLLLAALRHGVRETRHLRGADTGEAGRCIGKDSGKDSGSDSGNDADSDSDSDGDIGNCIGDDSGKDSDSDANEGTRALWAAQGISVNELARPALGLNLPQAGCRPDGQPRYWSLRQLLREAPYPAWAVAQRDVFVCENPNLLAMAADALGPRCAPLVCTDGMPAAAQRALLGQLGAAGAVLRYHGDFDWAGIAIANRVLQDFGAQAWRMGAADYLAAVGSAAADARAPLLGTAVNATWDSALTAALQTAQCAVAEEALADTLWPDLAAPG